MIASNRSTNMYQNRIKYQRNFSHHKAIFKTQKLSFEQIYEVPIPELANILQDDQICKCQTNMQSCQKTKNIIHPEMHQQALQRYENLKHNLAIKSQNSKILIKEQVLQPHFNNLLNLLKTSNHLSIYLILKHAKCEYLTFWIYGNFCTRWPKEHQFYTKINQIIQNNKLNCDVYEKNFDQQSVINQTPTKCFQQAYSNKMAHLFPTSYLVFVRLVLQKNWDQFFIEKVAICALMKGRNRKNFQIIKLALNL